MNQIYKPEYYIKMEEYRKAVNKWAKLHSGSKNTYSKKGAKGNFKVIEVTNKMDSLREEVICLRY